MFNINKGLASVLTVRDTWSCPKCRSTNTRKLIWEDKLIVNERKKKYQAKAVGKLSEVVGIQEVARFKKVNIEKSIAFLYTRNGWFKV